MTSIFERRDRSALIRWWWLMVVLATFIMRAQNPESRPKPGSKAISQGQSARRTFVRITANADCKLTIDGKSFRLERGVPHRIPISIGNHLMVAVGAKGEGVLQEGFTVEDPVEDVLSVAFRPQVVTARGSGQSTPASAYIWIPPGSFQMGCVPDDRLCNNDEKPRHKVTFRRGFFIGATEVTVGDFRKYPGEMPSPPPSFNIGWQATDQPMVKVSWDDASNYCQWIGGKLPTEAEWEYAARGGKDGLVYPWGADVTGTGAVYQAFRPAPARHGQPNGFGLYGMSGNVAEWCRDWYGSRFYSISPEDEPIGPRSGTARVFRGGSWMDNSTVLRASARRWNPEDEGGLSVGFRCILEPDD